MNSWQIDIRCDLQNGQEIASYAVDDWDEIWPEHQEQVALLLAAATSTPDGFAYIAHSSIAGVGYYKNFEDEGPYFVLVKTLRFL